MGQLVIAAYRPHEGKGEKLLDLVREHVPVLRKLGLVTDRIPVVMRSADGTILEIFEWRSEEAVDEAHHNDEVQGLWTRFSAVCDYESLASLEESHRPFPHFEPVEL